ncbi:MAG: fructosamine kinase family protein [Omnitrophica WOR_2 bacterium]
MAPNSVKEWLQANGYGSILSERPVGGGCINNGARLQTESGKAFFLKSNGRTPADMFEREAEGLDAIRVESGPRVPRSYLYGKDFILLEDLTPAARRPDYWPDFGRKLAALHNHTGSQFGFDHDNYLGSTPQPNAWTDDGYVFYAGQRLMYQAKLAQRNGLLRPVEVGKVERLCSRLKEWVPIQPASLIHGDLWSGNVLSDEQGAPAVIDPAVYYGWAEAELAYTALFGAFPQAFYQAYQEVRPLEPGFWERSSLYNLYHLLNHLNLFGEGYFSEVISVIRRYMK